LCHIRYLSAREEMECFFVGRRVAVEAIFGCDEPEVAIEVFENIIDAVYRYAKSAEGLARIALEVSHLRIEYVLSVSMCDPEEAFGPFHDAGDEVVGDGGGISDILSEDLEVVTIVSVEAGHGAEPHEALAVFINAIDLVGG